MAVYLGKDQKRRLRVGSAFMHIPSSVLYEGILLKSSDNYILKDYNGLYLIPKDSIIVVDNILLSSDNYILKDSNGVYLIPNFNY